MKKKELYEKLICALTHNLDACDNCKKCGINSGHVRTELIKEIAERFGYNAPWEEDTNEGA